MKKSDLMEMALEKLVGDMDDLEGSASMAHESDECPDPLTCTMHDSESADNLSGEDNGGVEGAIKKLGAGIPSMEGDKEESESPAEEGMSAEDIEALRKLLK